MVAMVGVTKFNGRRRRMRHDAGCGRSTAFSFVVLWAVIAAASRLCGQAPAPVIAPDVHHDGSVTFR